MRPPGPAWPGGEHTRAILARLFSKPANLLVLDEPTNDLDIETLELLEEILLSFDGTVILVSHDRDFMDNVVTSLLVAEGDGVISEHAGGYSDWEARGGRLVEVQGTGTAMPTSTVEQAESTRVEPVTTTSPRKLSYKDQRELDALPALIEELEQQQGELEETIAEPAFYQGERDVIDATIQALAATQAKLEQAYERWAELDG